jgi:Integrase core domain
MSESKEIKISQKEQMDQLSKELHKPFSKKYPRRKVRASYLDEIWSIDLADMQEWKDDNDGANYILCVVDVFSRYAFCRALKSKKAIDTYAALLDIIDTSKRKPLKKIWCDQGSEFYNSLWKQWSLNNGVEIYSTYSTEKSVIVERFHRTLKGLMWKRFTAENTRRWVDMLPDLVKTYNLTSHTTLGKMTPFQASLPEWKAWVEPRVNVPLQEEGGEKRVEKFKIGDIVRIARTKMVFEKGYLPNWSRETFRVVSIRIPDDNKEPLTYKLKDMLNEEVQGSFYSEELQSVKYPDFILIEKVLKEKKIKGKDMMMVKYLGWSDKFNRWMPKGEGKEI